MKSSDWNQIRLGDFVTLQRGHDLTASDRKQGNVPVMGSAGVTGYHNKALVKGPGVTIGRSGVGSMGVVNYCQGDYWPHNTVLYVTDFKGNYPLFAYYFFKSMDLRSFDSGSAQASLNRNYLYPTIISIPSYNLQKDIADFLFDLEKKIELNNATNRTLEFMARAVFDHFFMEFEPLIPNPNSTHQGWTYETMENYCLTVTRGVTPKYSPGSGRLIINQRANRGTEIDWNELKELTPDLDVPSEKYASKYDVLVNSLGEGTLGRIHLFLEDWATLAVDQHMSICRTSSPAKSLYIYYLLSSPIGQDRIEAVKTGSTGMTMLNISKLREFDFLSPPDALLTRFSNFALPIWDKITSNQKESRTLASLRDSLLPKLMRGEVRVSSTDLETD